MSGGENGIRQWQVSDGREVWKALENDKVYAIVLSRDHQWVVSGGKGGASVWDAKSHDRRDKVLQVDLSSVVFAVDISPDSTKFATGTGSTGTNSHSVNVWDITTGERLVGPLDHGGFVGGVKFSPNGNHIATFTRNHIRVFDSRTGDQLIIIEHTGPSWSPITPIVWSSDSQLFAMSKGGKIKRFDTSTGSQLAEWQIHDDSHLMSISISANNRFIASSAGRSVSFWDTSTHAQLGIVDVRHNIRSIALSDDGRHLATGGYNASRTATIWDLHTILPESYLPITVSTTFPMLGRPITSIYGSAFLHACKPTSSLHPECEYTHLGDTSFLNIDLGTKVSPSSKRPLDDGSHPDPSEMETGSQDDDDALLEVKWIGISLENAGLMPVIGRVAREDICPVIQL